MKLQQFSFLLPGGPFEVLKDNKQLKIIDNYKIVGHFSRQSLQLSLQDAVTQDGIKHNICMVYDREHACEISYRDNKWHFYDPENYEGAQSFVHLKDLVETIIRELSHDICIELAFLGDEHARKNAATRPFSYYYEELLVKNPDKLIKNNGLHTIVQHTSLFYDVLTNLGNRKKPERLKLDIPDSQGWSLLLLAIYNNDQKTVSALCEAGADLINGISPLHFAVTCGNFESVMMLCLAGAHPEKSDDSGWTPIRLAKHYGYTQLYQALCVIAQYRKDIDTLANFVTQHLEFVDEQINPVTILYAKFQQYCETMKHELSQPKPPHDSFSFFKNQPTVQLGKSEYHADLEYWTDLLSAQPGYLNFFKSINPAEVLYEAVMKRLASDELTFQR